MAYVLVCFVPTDKYYGTYLTEFTVYANVLSELISAYQG